MGECSLKYTDTVNHQSQLGLLLKRYNLNRVKHFERWAFTSKTPALATANSTSELHELEHPGGSTSTHQGTALAMLCKELHCSSRPCGQDKDMIPDKQFIN